MSKVQTSPAPTLGNMRWRTKTQTGFGRSKICVPSIGFYCFASLASPSFSWLSSSLPTLAMGDEARIERSFGTQANKHILGEIIV
jgi:hypothetical protein